MAPIDSPCQFFKINLKRVWPSGRTLSNYVSGCLMLDTHDVLKTGSMPWLIIMYLMITRCNSVRNIRRTYLFGIGGLAKVVARGQDNGYQKFPGVFIPTADIGKPLDIRIWFVKGCGISFFPTTCPSLGAIASFCHQVGDEVL